VSKSSSKLGKVAKSISAGAALASLVAFNAITAGSAWAQPIPVQPSPTMQRLQQFQKVERNRQSAEDAKWRSFRGHQVDTAAPWFFDTLTKRPPRCEFYWPGWKLHPDEARVTKVRGCSWDWVAVDCKSLKVSWQRGAWNRYSPKSAYSSGWETPTSSTDSGLQTVQMVAELCENIAFPVRKNL